jgi:hypothetical protein
MLFNKTWLDTRWRFLIGFGLLLMFAFGNVFEYPALARLVPIADKVDATGPLASVIRDAVEVQRTFRGFIWFQFVRQNLSQMLTLFAVLLGSGGLLAQASGGSAQFTLSLPISRNEVLGTRIATCVAELFVLAMVPFLVIPLFAPAVAQSYSLKDVLVHGTCAFVGGAFFFSLAIFLSTLFTDIWRPILITCVVAVLLGAVEQVVPVGIYRMMSAEAYFRSNQLPLAGLLTSMTLSAALIYGATTNFARQDF